MKHRQRAKVAVRPVCCAGELAWDLLATKGGLASATSFAPVAGGAAANVARELVRQGVAVCVAGGVSDDALGRRHRAELEAAGVDASAVVTRAGRMTLVLAGSGPRRRDAPSAATHAVGYLGTLVGPPWALPRSWSGSWLHVAALPPRAPELLELAALVAEAHERGARVSADINARPAAWRGARWTRQHRHLCSRTVLTKASARDLEVVGLADDGAVARALGVRGTLALTRAGGTASVSGAWGGVEMAPRKRASQHALGAGDVFVATLIAAMIAAEGHETPTDPAFWRRALASAHAAAATHLAARRR
jgi:sugar/nucleoside kinase (ribokinase family)